MFNKFNVFVAALVLISTTNISQAEIVKPILSGWFHGAKIKNFSACGRSEYHYDHFTQGPSIELARQLLPISTQEDCQWQEVEQLPLSFSPLPGSFPGSVEDWDYFSQNPANVTQAWARRCLDKYAREIDRISIELEPNYICPPGFYESSDRETLMPGCTNKPSGCMADVVARNMDVPVFGFLGHLGLVYGGLYVLEILNGLGDGSLQINELDSFINKTQFWGERYGTASKPDLNSDEAFKIAQAGERQLNCPVDYEKGWDYKPCTSNPKVHAKFRCDSFIQHAYQAGAGIDLGFKRFVSNPRSIFYTLTSERYTDGHKPLQQPKLMVERDNPFINNAETISAAQFEQALAQEPGDLATLDATSKAYLLSKTIPRADKLTFMWQQLKKYHNNEDKFSYLLDIIEVLHPIEKTQDIINSFYDDKNVEIKSKYLRLLIDSFYWNKSTEYPQQKVAIESFFQDRLHDLPLGRLLAEVINIYPESLVNEGNYQFTIEQLEKLHYTKPVDFENVVSFVLFWYKWLGLMNVVDESQRFAVAERLYQLANTYSQGCCEKVRRGLNHESFNEQQRKICYVFNQALAERLKESATFQAAKPLLQKNIVPLLSKMALILRAQETKTKALLAQKKAQIIRNEQLSKKRLELYRQQALAEQNRTL